MDELRHCPFCGAGGEDNIRVFEYCLPPQESVKFHSLNMIICRNCGGALIDQNRNHCWNDRVAAWNRRANNA